MKAEVQSLKEMYGKPNCWEKSSAPLVRFWTGDTSCWGFPFFAVAGTEYVPDRSGCSPPRLSTTQLPSTSDRQCSVRLGLSPSCWCALSGALAARFRRARLLQNIGVVRGTPAQQLIAYDADRTGS
jgi:hypothetical protein